MKELDADTSASLYELTQHRMTAAGLPAYEVSNHAAPGQESRHNLVYWRYGDYLGVGPGAHGRLTVDGARIATATERQPEAWLALVIERGDGLSQWDAIASEAQGTEALLMGLRLSEGIDYPRIESLLGRKLPQARLARLEAQGLIVISGTRMRATQRGRIVLNAVLREIAA